MKGTQTIVALAFKAVALAMAVASIVLAVLKVASMETYVVLLSIGLFALALTAIMQRTE